jgi:outer membrane murein-binding lipoprotein Lpp
MEEDKIKTSEINITKEEKPSTDIKPLENDKAPPDWLTPILSALGGMGGSYMLFIKPLQERMNELSTQVIDLRSEVKELRQQNRDLEKEVGNIQSNQNNDVSEVGYLPIKKSIGQGSYLKKRI